MVFGADNSITRYYLYMEKKGKCKGIPTAYTVHDMTHISVQPIQVFSSV